MKVKKIIKEKKFEDLGFGSQVSQQKLRFVNKDGSFNVERRGLSYFEDQSIYNALVTMRWSKFIFLVFLFYIIINAIFASFYMLIGLDHLAGIKIGSAIENYTEAFFFSVQTFTTVGYGRVSPIGIYANILSSIESITGLLTIALATGLLFTKFSRPNAKIIFSEYALIAPYQGITAFMFRTANQRKNQIIELEIEVTLSINQKKNGETVRTFHDLKLERRHLQFFPLSWTIVHPIDEESPLNNLTEEEFLEAIPEFLILFKGFDDTFSQTVHTRSSYVGEEIIWGAKFSNIFDRPLGGKTTINMDKISAFEKVKIIS